MRVGVSVSAMMMGGCDAVAEAKARVLGDEPAAAEAPVAAPTAAPVATTTAPEPMLLPRDGISGVVADTVARSKASELDGDRSFSSPRPVSPVEPARPHTEPEGSRSFVPFSGSGGAIAGTVEAPTREVASPKPRTRPRPKLARPVEDEPCDPAVSALVTEPKGGWVCGPCGRG